MDGGKYPNQDQSGIGINYFLEKGYISTQEVRLSAERLALAYAMGIKQQGLADRHRVACAIVYNGKVYFGHSYHQIPKNQLPEKLQDAMRQRSAEQHHTTNCAEILAMKKLVEDGYDSNQMGQGLEFYACRTDTGEPLQPCGNCIMLLGMANGVNL